MEPRGGHDASRRGNDAVAGEATTNLAHADRTLHRREAMTRRRPSPPEPILHPQAAARPSGGRSPHRQRSPRVSTAAAKGAERTGGRRKGDPLEASTKRDDARAEETTEMASRRASNRAAQGPGTGLRVDRSMCARNRAPTRRHADADSRGTISAYRFLSPCSSPAASLAPAGAMAPKTTPPVVPTPASTSLRPPALPAVGERRAGLWRRA